MIKWITPTLGVEEGWDLDVDFATTAVQEGGTVIVGSEDVATQVLHNLGLTQDEVEDRFHFANTGQVLHG
jgi:hypothetical protein